jgi:predicted XRE-type DNA-binding protein
VIPVWRRAAAHAKINKFSLDTLLILATRAGLKVKIDVPSAA